MVVVADAGAVDARAFARVHLDEAVGEVARLDLLERGDAVLHAVHGKVCIARVLVRVHRAQDAALDGEEARFFAVLRLGGRGLQLHAGFLHPGLQLFKCQHDVAVAVQRGLLFFGDARPDKDGGGPGVLLLDQLAVGQHGREHRRKT